MKGPHQLSSDWAYRRVLYYCALRGLACSPAPPIAPTTPTTSPSKHHAPSGVNRSYLKAQLQEKEVRGYKAAGVLPIAYFPSPPPDRLAGPNHQEQEDHQELVPYVLLGTERRDSGEGPILNILGGKREVSDGSPAATAWREFWEESGRLLGDQEQPFLDHFLRGGEQRRVLWFVPGGYALFIHHLPFPAPEWTAEIVSRYRRQEVREKGSEMDALHWVSLSALLEAARRKGNTAVYSAGGQAYPIFRFCLKMLLYLSSYLDSVVSGQPHTTPIPVVASSPSGGHSRRDGRWKQLSPHRSTSPNTVGGGRAQGVPGRAEKSSGPTLVPLLSRMSANAPPFYRHSTQRPKQQQQQE